MRDDIQVRAALRLVHAHRTVSQFTRETLKRAAKERRARPHRRHTRAPKPPLHAGFIHQKRKAIFDVSNQYSLLLLREIAGCLQQELQGYANEF